MQIAICAGRVEDARIIRGFLQDHFYKNGYEGHIHLFKCAQDLVSDFTPGKFKVVFLDIYREEITGIVTAQKLRTIDPEFALVYITSDKTLGKEAFSCWACACITIPITEKDMKNILKQCQPIFIKEARTIKIISNRSPVRIPCVKIYYVEIYQKDALFHTCAGVIKTRMALSAIEKKLGFPFLRCHRSYLVNMNHIEHIYDQDILVTNGDRIPVRQRGKSQIHDLYGDFLSKKLLEYSGW